MSEAVLIRLLEEANKTIARLEGPNRRKNWWVEYREAERRLQEERLDNERLRSQLAILEAERDTWAQSLRPASLPPQMVFHLPLTTEDE